MGDFKWLDSQDILEILSIQFGVGLNMGYEKKGGRVTKDDSMVFFLKQ